MGASGFMALGEIAKPVVPTLIALFEDKDTDIRYLSVFALRSLGPVAKDALPHLIRCLDDPEFIIRDDAVTAMGTIHEKPEQVIPILTNFLQKWHSRTILCVDATIALGKFEAQARTAVPTILELLNDNEANIRVAATNALKQIDPDAAAKAGAK